MAESQDNGGLKKTGSSDPNMEEDAGLTGDKALENWRQPKDRQ